MIVAILMFVICRLNINDDSVQKTANMLDTVITFLVFLITLVNVGINGIGMATEQGKNSNSTMFEILQSSF